MKTHNYNAGSTLEGLLRTLDRFRHFPAYRLEPRVDGLFAEFLPLLVGEHLGLAMRQAVVPEFPIKRDLVMQSQRPSNLSFRVDFGVFAAAEPCVALVEVKTDPRSRRPDQDRYLRETEALGFGPILAGLLEVARASKATEKYSVLLAELTALGCLTANGSEPRPTPWALSARVQVVLLEPVATDPDRSLDFAAVASILERLGDNAGAIAFARFLRTWARHPAGSGRGEVPSAQ